MDRKVRVAAFTDKNPKTSRNVQDNLDWSVDMIDRIAAEAPDIIALTENFNTRGTGRFTRQLAETLDGPTMKLMRAKARQHGCYLIPSFNELRGEYLFNTSVVIDRQGEMVGQYDKIHPTDGEMEYGIVPGTPLPTVIDTDFGRIGCQICFDACWSPGWNGLADAGAEIIFFSSAYPGGRTLTSMATLYHVPIVTANTPTCCAVIDVDGMILTRQGIYRNWVIATLHLDSPLFHLSEQFEKMEQVRVKYGKDITIRVYEEEGWWRIYPQNDAISVKDIIKEFSLVTLKEFLARCESHQNDCRRIPG